MSQRVSWWSDSQLRALLYVLVIVLAVESWFPFRPELPVVRQASPTIGPGTSVRFDGDAALESDGAAAWLEGVRTDGEVEVRLDARADRVDQGGPARLLAISKDPHNADLMIGQQGPDLVVRMRRPGSDAAGAPAVVVDDVFARPAWRSIDVAVRAGVLTVAVDGHQAIEVDLGPNPLRRWDDSYRLALGNEPRGERGWAGELRTAEVATGGGTVDLLAPGALSSPRGWLLNGRVVGLLEVESPDHPIGMVARAVAFLPVGAAAQLLWRRWARSGVLVTVVAALLLGGKAFVAERHPVLSDALLSVLGGWVGVALASAWLVRRREGSPLADLRCDDASTVLSSSSTTKVEGEGAGQQVLLRPPGPIDRPTPAEDLG